MATLFDLTMALSDTIDLIDAQLGNHHKRVAYIACSLGAELGMDTDKCTELLMAWLLHDAGILSGRERRELLQFSPSGIQKHAELGYLLLKTFEPFSIIAEFIRFHHVNWLEGAGSRSEGRPVHIGSHILHLADRIDISIDRSRDVLGQAGKICRLIEEHTPAMFMPQLCEAFKSIASKEFFWFDIASPTLKATLIRTAGAMSIELDYANLYAVSKLFAKIIDFRSRFTATHTEGVVATAKTLAKRLGFSEKECQMIEIAGYLHDLGKLGVPPEILEKPDQLTEEEFNIIKRHTFYTFRVLEAVPDFELINEWASFHHERLDSKGYPFKYTGANLTLGSRIIAVADIFTALAEDRPYRKAMPREKLFEILYKMTDSAVDSHVVDVLNKNYDEINSARITAQTVEFQEYQKWRQLAD